MDAEAKNLRGQNPLHLLASYGRDSVAASICELFRECMPAYPLDQPDLEGNTGNGCRVYTVSILLVLIHVFQRCYSRT
jgi:hypothetical protein